MTALRLLVAEDERIAREIIGTVLARQGHAVTLAADGRAALDSFRPGRFDAVLLDVQMPGLDGLAATALLRAAEREAGARPVPIVALTAGAGADEVARCLAAGMDAHVAKPIDWPTLFETLARLGGAAAATPAAESQPSSGPAVFDESVLAELAQLIGRDRVAGFLAQFDDEARATLAALDDPRATEADRAAKAHTLAAFAGQLGFTALAAACAAVQSPDGRGAAGLAALRAAGERALAAAARRRGEADFQG